MSLETGWDNFRNVINDSVAELKKQEIASAQRIDMFILVVANIIRFIDQKILVNLHFLSSGNDMKFVPEYFPENGILVYLNNTDKYESAVETVSVNDMFPQEQKEFRRLRGIRGGEEYFLTRDCKLIGLSRTGDIWDAWSTDEDGNFYTLANPKECTALELVKKYSNFEQEMIFNFKMAVAKAIKRNENKRPMLKRVIEYINALDKKKQQGQDLEARLEQNPKDAQAHVDYAFHLLRVMSGSSDFAGAKHHFQVALSLEPSNPEIHMLYGGMLTNQLWLQTVSGKGLSQDVKKEAEEHLLAAIELAPENTDAHRRYAYFLWWPILKSFHEDLLAWGQDNPAELQKIDAEYRKIFDLDPDYVDALNNYVGYLFWVKRDYSAIIPVGEHLVKLAPTSNNYTQILRGMYQNWLRDASLRKQYTPSQAEEWINRAAQLCTIEAEKRHDNGHADFSYAEFMFWEKHDVNAAELELQRILRFEPENDTVHTAMGDLLFLGREDRQGARHEYEEALNILKRRPAAADTRSQGLVLLRLAAVDFLEGSIETGLTRIDAVLPWTPEATVTGLFFQYAYSKDRSSQNDALVDLKAFIPKLRSTNSAFQMGVLRQNWLIIQLPWHVKQAIHNGHPNPNLLRALADVISNTAPGTILDKFPGWVASR